MPLAALEPRPIATGCSSASTRGSKPSILTTALSFLRVGSGGGSSGSVSPLAAAGGKEPDHFNMLSNLDSVSTLDSDSVSQPDNPSAPHTH
jgi:hypothetical protein